MHIAPKILCFTMLFSVSHTPQKCPFHGSNYTPCIHVPWTHSTQQPKLQLDRFSHFCTDDRRMSLYFTLGCHFRPSKVKIAPSHGGSGPPSNTWFPGPTRVLNPNGVLIGSAVFAGLTSVTDRPTDHYTRSVTTGRIYVRSTGNAV